MQNQKPLTPMGKLYSTWLYWKKNQGRMLKIKIKQEIK